MVFGGRKNFPNVIVDGRVELLSLIFHLAGNPEYNQCKIPSYKKDLEIQFGRYNNHPVVKMAREFLAEARLFVQQTGFKKFFNEHKKLYDTTSARMKKFLFKYGHFNWFDDFFGPGPDTNFTVILGMLNGDASYGPAAVKKQILIEIKNKFIWIEELSNLLTFYETNREKYPDLDSFFNRLVDFFNTYSHSNKETLATIEKEKEKQWTHHRR